MLSDFRAVGPRNEARSMRFGQGIIVRAVVPGHLRNAGVHVGRMAAKANGAFTITTKQGKVTDIGYRYCTRLQRDDGYAYLMR